MAEIEFSRARALAEAREATGLTYFGDDAFLEGLDVLRYGVLQARRGGLSAGDVANTLGWDKLKQLVGRPASPTGQEN